MVDDEPSQRLTMSLVERCIAGSGSKEGAEQRASELLKVEVLRLDWQRIESIQNLEIFTHLRELYLQHNRIDVIEELDTLRSLQFLALGSNRIRRLENLRHLTKLQVLDLSNNMIESVDTQEVPRGLVIFSLVGNSCCLDPGIRQRLTSSLPALKALDGEPVERPSQLDGVEEYKGSVGCIATTFHEESKNREGGKSEEVTLYVTVHSGGGSKIVPFHFSPAENMMQLAGSFCAENGLHGGSATETLVDHMRGAISGRRRLASFQASAPESEELSTEHNDQEDTSDADLPEVGDRLHAIVRLQKARARVMEESTASFEQHKKSLLSATRKLVEQKTASAHGRSDVLEEGIHQILEDAREELQIRRARVSAENRQFATDMRERVERVLTERRQETEAAKGARAIISSPREV